MSQDIGKLLGRLQTETIALKFKLPQGLICQKHRGQILALFVINLLAAQMQGLDCLVVSDDLCEDECSGCTELYSGHRVIVRCIIIVCFLQEGKHTTAETLALLLLHSLFSCSIGSRSIALLLSFLVSILLLSSLSFLLLLLVS